MELDAVRNASEIKLQEVEKVMRMQLAKEFAEREAELEARQRPLSR